MEISKVKEELQVSYFSIFRYGTWLEVTATVAGVILGLLSGGGVCFLQAYMAEIINSFVERTSQQDKLSTYLPLTQLFGGGRRLINASDEENMEALIEDAKAMAIGVSTGIGVSMLLNIASVSLIGWSALAQSTRIRILFLKAVLRQDMSWFDTNNDFNFASKMTENIIKLKEGMSEKLGVVSHLVGTALFSVLTSFMLGWELTLACISLMPLSLLASYALTNYQGKSSLREIKANSLAGKHAEEVLKSIRTVVAFGGEQKECERYKSLLEPAERYGRRRGLFTGLGNGFNWVLTYAINSIGFAYGARLVLNDHYKEYDENIYLIRHVFCIIFYTYRAILSITLCIPHVDTFAAACSAAVDIFKLIEQEPTIGSGSEDGISPGSVRGEISIEDVHFSYPSRPDIKVLKGFSMNIKPGERVALVGRSGCGKSTVIQLLQRLYEPNSGTVKFDGKDIKNLNINWLRASLGVVGQDPVLFRGTIHDNIAIGCPEATRDDVQRTAEEAFAHDFISKLPNGYEAQVGEFGASMSGGQRQRLALARALLNSPSILLLDEPTAALDASYERRVQAALDRATRGRTVLTVSHSLSTIVKADRIICMDEGVIVEQGTHEELMSSQGFYYTLMTKRKGESTNSNKNEEEDNASAEMSQSVETGISNKLNGKHHKQSTEAEPTEETSSGIMLSSTIINQQNNSNANECEEDEEDKVKPITNIELFKLNAPEWAWIAIGAIAAIISGASFNGYTVLFGFATGIFIVLDQNELLWQADMYAWLFLVVAATAGIATSVQSYSFINSGLKMITRLRYQYFSALLKQEMAFHDKNSNSVGAICARLSGDTAQIQGATGLRIGIILQGLSSVTVGLIISVYYNWKITLVAIAFIPIIVGCICMEGIMSKKSQDNERAASEDATAIATEAVINIKTVKSLGIEMQFLNKFEASLATRCGAVAMKLLFRGLVFGLCMYVPFMAYCCCLVYGAKLVAQKELDFKIVIMITHTVMHGAFMLGQAMLYAPGFNSTLISGARILSIIRREPKVKTEEGVTDKPDWTPSGSFTMKDVQFSYPTRPNQQIMSGVELRVEAGTTVALVGSSGSGKSTLLQLMQRFYDPDTGNIELDSHDIRKDMSLQRLRRQFGAVQQQPALLDRSIAENIAYGDNSRLVPMHDIVDAAKAVNIHNFIVSLPQGYQTSLGAGGTQASGGQKQRLCVARALLRAPPLLLLDEPTSALDHCSERAVCEALEKAAKGRTCITIAHRLSTIKDANLICVLDQGKIVEHGTHAELINQRGLYWNMWEQQISHNTE